MPWKVKAEVFVSLLFACSGLFLTMKSHFVIGPLALLLGVFLAWAFVQNHRFKISKIKKSETTNGVENIVARDDFDRVFEEVPGAREWFDNAAKSGRKFNPQVMLDQLVKEGKAEAITLPEDPEEAKQVLTEIMKNYPVK